jgi:hypothetical protein
MRKEILAITIGAVLVAAFFIPAFMNAQAQVRAYPKNAI